MNPEQKKMVREIQDENTAYRKAQERMQEQAKTTLDLVAIVGESLREALTYCPVEVRQRIAKRLKGHGIDIVANRLANMKAQPETMPAEAPAQLKEKLTR